MDSKAMTDGKALNDAIRALGAYWFKFGQPGASVTASDFYPQVEALFTDRGLVANPQEINDIALAVAAIFTSEEWSFGLAARLNLLAENAANSAVTTPGAALVLA